MNAYNQIEEIVRHTDTGFLDEHYDFDATPDQIAQQLVDAHRAEVLAADGQAFDGELAMLRGLVRTIAAVVGNDGSAEKQTAEVRQLLAEHAGDEAHARLLAMDTPEGAPRG